MDVALKPKKGATSPTTSSVAVRFKANFNNCNNKNNKRAQTGPNKMDKKQKASSKKETLTASSDNENNGASCNARNKSSNSITKRANANNNGGSSNSKNNSICNASVVDTQNAKICKPNSYEKPTASPSSNNGGGKNNSNRLDIDISNLCLNKSNIKTFTPNQKQHQNKHSPASKAAVAIVSSTLSTNVGTLAAAADAAVNKMKKSFNNKNQIALPLQTANLTTASTTTALALPLSSTLSTSLSSSSPSTALLPAGPTALAAVGTTDIVQNSSNNYNTNNNNSNGSAVVNNNTNKNYEVPSDVLDDLATRFIINVPDIELSNLIRICFQIELAHWFYLDFFCDGGGVATASTNNNAISTGEVEPPVKVLQPLGIKYFAIQLFKHIPFLSEHLPSIDKILEDWKNYKLSVPTYGAILISEDLQYCLLVQSYFAKTSWGFPKGKVNETEDPEHCATREVFEETGFDITNLIRPKDFIDTVLNYQYTRLYIVCNVSLDTVFLPQTRKEIRACNWFPIDCLPNNKNDAISKAKLGQNANSFFMILPFVKRLKKWVNEKRAQAGMLETAAITGATGISLEMSLCNSNNTNAPNNNSNKTNQSRKYSNGCQLNSNTNSSNNTNNNNANNTAATLLNNLNAAITGAIPKTPSAAAYVGDMHFMKNNNNKHTNNAATSGKKQRQQQQHQTNGSNQNNRNRKNNTNNNSNSILNNVAGIFKLSDVESSTFAAAASAAANACLKRQRHKSMGDLDNMKLHNNNTNNNVNSQSNSCNKNHKNQQQRQQQQQHTNNNNSGKRNSNQKVQERNENSNSPNATTDSNGGLRRQLFHSQSQNDCGNYIGDIEKSCIEQQIVNTFDLIRQQQQQYVNKQEKPLTDELLFDGSKIVAGGTERNRRHHMRQRAKSQSDKHHQQHQQEQQQQQKQVCFYNNNIINASITTSQSSHQQNQRSMIFTQTSSSTTTTTQTITGQELENMFAADLKTDNTKIEQKIGGLALNATSSTAVGGIELQNSKTTKLKQQEPQCFQHFSALVSATSAERQNITAVAAKNNSIVMTPTSLQSSLSTNAVVEASAIETRLIQEQKMLQTTKQQQQQKFELPTTSQQQHHNPLQHSASSPGLATWKNFSFTKNLISNVFL